LQWRGPDWWAAETAELKARALPAQTVPVHRCGGGGADHVIHPFSPGSPFCSGPRWCQGGGSSFRSGPSTSTSA